MDEILFDERGGTGWVTLNRPKALNALTHAMARRLDARPAARAEAAPTAPRVVGGAACRPVAIRLVPRDCRPQKRCGLHHPAVDAAGSDRRPDVARVAARPSNPAGALQEVSVRLDRQRIGRVPRVWH